MGTISDEDKQRIESMTASELVSEVNALSRNSPNPSAGKFRGITFDKRRQTFCAAFELFRKRIFIGYYGTAEEAALAYDKRAFKELGRYCSTSCEWTHKGRLVCILNAKRVACLFDAAPGELACL